MRLILNRDDLVKILQEDEEIRDLIRKLALGQPEEGEAHEVPEGTAKRIGSDSERSGLLAARGIAGRN